MGRLALHAMPDAGEALPLLQGIAPGAGLYIVGADRSSVPGLAGGRLGAVWLPIRHRLNAVLIEHVLDDAWQVSQGDKSGRLWGLGVLGADVRKGVTVKRPHGGFTVVQRSRRDVGVIGWVRLAHQPVGDE